MHGIGAFLSACGSCVSGICCASKSLPPSTHGKFGEGVVNSRDCSNQCGQAIDRFFFGGSIPEDKLLGELLFSICGQLRPTEHKDVCSLCLIIHKLGDQFYGEVGSNLRAASCGGGCCAEECALGKLIMNERGQSPLRNVLRVIIFSDGPVCSVPDIRSREILSEHLEMNVEVVCAWYDDGEPNPQILGRSMRIRVMTVGDLHPYPNAYRHVQHGHVATFARQFSGTCHPVHSELGRKLYDATLDAAGTMSDHDMSHPVHYAAGVLLLSGEVCVSSAISGSCSTDSVSKLFSCLGDHQSSDDPPQLLMVCDQWGVLHTPFASGRNYLIDGGFGTLPLIFHQAPTGQTLEKICSDLIINSRPRKFRINIAKQGRKLGVEILKLKSQSLSIEAVKDGLVTEWNDSFPDCRVVIGSKILEVNGEADCERMVEEILQAEQLDILVQTPY